jgi:hypothetical protein
MLKFKFIKKAKCFKLEISLNLGMLIILLERILKAN